MSVELEQAILGEMLQGDAAVGPAVERLRPTDFSNPKYGKIFGVMREMFLRSEPIDILTLYGVLGPQGVVGVGLTDLIDLRESHLSSANIESHCKLLRVEADKRALHTVCRSVIESNGSGDVESISHDLRAVLSDVDGRDRVAVWRMADLALRTNALIDGYRKSGGISGPSWGYAGLDLLTGGLRAGDYNVIAGRPGMGKTTLALNVALKLSRSGVPVGIFSMEMTETELMETMYACLSGVDSLKMRSGRASDDEYCRVGEVAAQIAELPIYVDPTKDYGIPQLKARAQRMAQVNGVQVLIVDYLQLIAGPKKSENRQQEISAISRACKIVAQECNLTVLALSQLSRAPELRTDHRPMLSDLRESGSIEQDADLVVFCYRPIKYVEKANPNKALLLVEKQRRGPCGRVEMLFWPESSRFEELEPTMRPENWYVDEGGRGAGKAS